MNEKGLDEDAFGEKSALQGSLKTFDAFRTLLEHDNELMGILTKEKNSQNKSIVHSTIATRRPMDGPHPHYLLDPLAGGVPHMVERHGKPPLQRGKGSIARITT